MPKNYFFLIIVFSTFLSFSFSKSENYLTECVSVETNAYITLKIWNPKSGKKYKIENARKDAIHALLYSGIAGVNGCGTQKPLLINSESIEKFKKIENDFFSNNGIWAQFTRSASTVSALPLNLSSKNWKVYQISVSKDALKKYLEEKSIIKSLNTGF
jgi:hypothetical protein